MTDAEQPETSRNSAAENAASNPEPMPQSASTPAATEPASPAAKSSKAAISPMRILLWVIVGGVGIFMIVSGLVGVMVKA